MRPGEAVHQLHLADARGAGELLGPHDAGQLFAELRQGREVQRGLPGAVTAEAGQALDDVGRVADLPQLSVADDGDARLDLLLDRLVHGGLHDLVEGLGVVGLAVVAGQQQRRQLGAARQAADMGGGDAYGHSLLQ
jgi:hypothetical protein